MNKVLFAILLFLSPFTFLTNPFIGVPGTDSSIFIHVARGIGKGIIPYRDVFDQKGPLLYFINALGWACGGVIGIWLLDIVVFCLVMWMSWRISIAIFGSQIDVRKSAILMLGVIAVLYHTVACGGNMPEMWIALFAAIAWYLVLRCALKGAILNTEALIMGICIGLVFMLKLNMIGIALPIAIVCLSHKNSNRMRSIFMAIVGIVVVVLPVIGWFAWRGGLSSLWEVYVCYNVQYAKAMQSGKGLFSIASSRAFWPVMAAVVANIWWVYICGEGGRWNIARLNLLFLFASFTLILASGGSSRYYGPVLPACVLPLCFLIDRLKCSRMMAFCGMMGCVLCIGALVFARHNGNVERMKYVALRRMGEEAGVVGSNSVIVLGCDCYAYKTLDAWCPSRFVFQGTIGRCSERYRSDIIKEIDSGKIRFIVAPKNVLTTPGHLGTTWAKDAVEHSYRRLSSNEDYDIWVCKDV